VLESGVRVEYANSYVVSMIRLACAHEEACRVSSVIVAVTSSSHQAIVGNPENDPSENSKKIPSTGRADFDSYLNTTVDCWSRPKADDELVLRQILKAADQWIYQAARRHVEMVPGNLRAKLQVFDGKTRIFYLLACLIRF
jgi:hypothetical protein